MKTLALTILLLTVSLLSAQQPSVIVVDLGNNVLAAIVTMPDGTVVAVPTKVFKMPTPQPQVLAARVFLLRETEQMDQQQADLEAKIRLSSLNPKIDFLDPTAEDQDGNVPLLVQAINQAVGSNPLPQLVAVGSDGSVVDNKSMPQTIEGIASVLKGWGL